ncbi:DNA methyltransferase [Paenibacillus polymyxa]|uniref:DNA methyltransferase n=1 Tax=Paenibacillus polymyxa TaxID=1406 RepID=UPI002019AF88|nr:DNA methyltransferase [Paenibacillus polymyxa]UQQ35581.1 hypothetical protein LMH85_01035 [Paenibacillus polymyxa]
MSQLTLFDDDGIQTNPVLSHKNLIRPALLKDLPFDKIYEVSRKEASRKKPIFFIHKYFARRTTCNFRLMLLSLLLPEKTNVWDHFYDPGTINKNDDVTIFDPFMGGGTTIFESARIGAKVIGNDLQPLSKLVTSAEIMPAPVEKIKKEVDRLDKAIGVKIKNYYTTCCPHCNKDADVMYNFHVNQARSKVNKEIIELYSSFVLSEKKGVLTLFCPECSEVFKSDSKNKVHCCSHCNHTMANPREGFVNRGKYKNPVTGEEDFIRNYKDGETYPFKTKIIAQEYNCSHCGQHDYKKVDLNDIDLNNQASEELAKLRDTLPIPLQLIPHGYNTKQMINHGYLKFQEMFTDRQLLCLGLLLKEIDMVEDDDVKFWLLVAFSASLEMNNKFCRYQYNAWKISNIFFNHAYVPLTMPVENNVWGSKLGTGTFIKSVNKLIKGKEFNENIYDIFINSKGESDKKYSTDKVNMRLGESFAELDKNTAFLSTGDSRRLDFLPDNSVDIVLTDPPYGSNVMYSELIDFFHVWLHQTNIGKNFGFTDPLSPKLDEIIVNPVRKQTYDDYSNGLKEVFKECSRITKKEGYLIFTFHDSKLESWFSVIDAIARSNYKLIAAYPIHSESRTGAHTSSKESIAFDIFLICIKDVCNEQEVSNELIESIKNEAFFNTDKIIKRLENINAEITIPDIENFFISQFFVSMFSNHVILSSALKEHLSITIKSIDNLIQSEKVVSKRTGWWSALYNPKHSKI